MVMTMLLTDMVTYLSTMFEYLQIILSLDLAVALKLFRVVLDQDVFITLCDLLEL